MKNAKKFLCLFLSISIFYCHILFSPTVYANSELHGEFENELPIVYELGSSFNRNSSVLGLVSSVVGSSTALTGSGLLVSALLGAGAVALTVGGAYVVGQGLINIYDNAKDWIVEQTQLNAINSSFSYDKFGSLTITNYPNTSVSFQTLSSIYANVSGEVVSGSINVLGTEYSYNLPPMTRFSKSTFSNLEYIFSSTNGFYFSFTTDIGGVSCPVIAKNITFTVRSLGENTSYSNRLVQGWFFNPNTGVWSNLHDFYISPADYLIYESNSLGLVLTQGFLGFNQVTSSQADRIMQSFVPSSLSQPLSVEIPNTYIGVLNPGLSWSGENWVNKETGEATDPKDIGLPFPNVFGENGFSFDKELDDSFGSVSDSAPPIDDGTVLPDIDFSSITGFLSSILDWLIAFPSWLITNLINVIVGAITSVGDVIGNIWSWCQDLPNILSNVLSGIIEFLQSIGMTLADILAFVISLPLELVNALIDMFVFVFVPSEGFFVSSFENILDNLELKFPFFGQIRDFFLTLNPFSPSEPPSIKITLPDFFGGGTYDFIDFYFFDKYRNYYLSLVRLFLWIFALKHVYRRLPSLISGGGSL